MRIPIPTDRLVALTLLGALLTSAVAVSLAAPGALPGPAAGDDPSALPADAPTPNPDFTPAVERQPVGDDEWEEEHEDGEDEHDDGEDEHDGEAGDDR